jgi:hypothetical protein
MAPRRGHDPHAGADASVAAFATASATGGRRR